ncbi:hypothetical protein PCC21_015160 [Pectobacterium carotovorum subsp. carotovorum PCC21]|nr:hypothetical protein PCC21_015160 [Pectobacterium carotovorum subsp. carotovorum PCC21]
MNGESPYKCGWNQRNAVGDKLSAIFDYI